VVGVQRTSDSIIARNPARYRNPSCLYHRSSLLTTPLGFCLIG